MYAKKQYSPRSPVQPGIQISFLAGQALYPRINSKKKALEFTSRLGLIRDTKIQYMSTTITIKARSQGLRSA